MLISKMVRIGRLKKQKSHIWSAWKAQLAVYQPWDVQGWG